MEGGLLLWRVQKIREVFPDIESYGKSLPPCPEGLSWLQRLDGSWELLDHRNKLKNDSIDETNVKIVSPTVIVHTILPSDTLQGICLRYNVPIIAVRRLNCFSGNNIKAFKTLKIPIESGATINLQEDTHEVLIQKFRNETGEDLVEAELYLEESTWNLESALLSWRGDENWHQTNPIKKEDIIMALDESIHDDSSHSLVATVPMAIAVAPFDIVLAEEISAMEGLSVQSNPAQVPSMKHSNFPRRWGIFGFATRGLRISRR